MTFSCEFFFSEICLILWFSIILRYDEVEVLRARVEAEMAGRDSTQALKEQSPVATPSSLSSPQAAVSNQTDLASSKLGTPEANLCAEISSAPMQQVFLFQLKLIMHFTFM